MCQSLFCGNGSQLVQTCLAISSKDFNSQYILRKKETERASKFSSGLLATTVFGSFGKDELFIHFFIYFINRVCRAENVLATLHSYKPAVKLNLDSSGIN